MTDLPELTSATPWLLATYFRSGDTAVGRTDTRRSNLPPGKPHSERPPETSSGAVAPSETIVVPSWLKATKLIHPWALSCQPKPIAFSNFNKGGAPRATAARKNNPRGAVPGIFTDAAARSGSRGAPVACRIAALFEPDRSTSRERKGRA